MLEQNQPKPVDAEPQSFHSLGPAVAPKKPAALNVDEARDEFIKNAQPVADALRKRGRGEEATQLEQAAKIIGVAVGTQPQQHPVQGEALKGESVGNVLKNIWDVIDKDPELKNMPQAQALRKSGKALDEAGLLNITIRNGVVVSFVSNFVENFSLAQKVVPTPAEKQPVVMKAAAARAPQPASVEQAPATAAALPTPTQQPAGPHVAPTQSTAPAAEAAHVTQTPDKAVAEQVSVPAARTQQVEPAPPQPAPAPAVAPGPTNADRPTPEAASQQQAQAREDYVKSFEQLRGILDSNVPGMKLHDQLLETTDDLAAGKPMTAAQVHQTEQALKLLSENELVGLFNKQGYMQQMQSAVDVLRPAVAPSLAQPQVQEPKPGALTPEEKPASLLVPEALEKAKALYRENTSPITQPTSGFTKEDLPGPLLAKMGVSVEQLEKSGQLQKLLSGQKTDLISSFSLRNEQGEAVPFAAKLVLRRDAVGAPNLQFDLPKHQLVIPEQILGKEITSAMKEQLTKHGVVPLADGFRDGKGQSFAAYVAIDKDMNRVVAVRKEGMTIPKEVLGVTLNPQQNKTLLEGRPTQMEAMRNSKGQLFDATVVLDPVKRQLTFRDPRPHVPQQKVEKAEPVVVARSKMRI